MSKHTPGPWMWMVEEKVDPNEQGHFPQMKEVAWDGSGDDSMLDLRNLRPASDLTDCILGGAWRNDSDADVWVSSKANARLIASAPDLLSACKLALSAFENNNCIDWGELEKAINKAEGVPVPNS